MFRQLHLNKIALLICTILTSVGWSQVTTFDYTGGMQTYIVPDGISSIQVEAFGAAGFGDLGYGGRVQAALTVTPGETLYIYVGGTGGATTGGYNGGGVPGSSTSYGGGGGASDVRSGGIALANRIIVAGGGGGSGSNCGLWTAEGGHGGGLIGESGCLYSCSDCQYTGAGGSQVAGGIAGPTGHGSCGENSDGTLGNGGSNMGAVGTGGGGGYYGGGSGCYEGAGGGSSYTDPDAEDVEHEIGVRDDHGQIIITVLCVGLTIDEAMMESCEGDEVTLSATSETGGSITWDMGVTDGEPFVPPLGLTTYTATSDSDSDCDLTVAIAVYAPPIVEATVDYTEVCEGDTVIFRGDGATDYEWTPADVIDGEPYVPTVTATYTVIGTDSHGCVGEEAEVSVTVFPSPTVTASASDSEVCFGDEVTFTTGGDATSYEWDMGIIDGEPTVMDEAGTLTFTVIGTNSFGCENSASVVVVVNEEITISYTTTDEVSGSDGAIDITVSGGTPAYEYDWDNDGTGDFDDDEDLTGLSGGPYTVVVRDELNCTHSETITVNSQVGIETTTTSTISIYPNPTSDLVILEIAENFSYSLTDISGATIINGHGKDVETISLGQFANGVYFITVNANGLVNTVKVIKK